MNPYSRYKEQALYSWTRIDMLLVVYEQTISSLQDGISRLEANEAHQLPAIRLRAMKCLVTIVDGLNLDLGETPRHIMRLCLYVLDQIEKNDAESWRSAEKIMQTLHDGFAAIQNEAREAEHRGQIPALEAV